MFRSKLGALVFVAGILFAVFRMVGTEDNGGDLATAADRIAAQRAEMEARSAQGAAPANWHDEELEDGGWGDEVLPYGN